MELKDYQQKALDQVKNYLQLLGEWKEKADKNPDLEINFPKKAWGKAEIDREYLTKKNGLGEYMPNFTLKIPTGGGKTFLAVKAIDLINDIFLRKQTGLVLWIVPTTQIYNQTIKSLRDKNHPYRQHLDIASGGKTLIKEKTDRFTPEDVSQNLVVLMLMLPSASRSKKEELRMFRDNGNFQQFFPLEDDIKGQEELLGDFPNLRTYKDYPGIWGKQILTSLGNTVAILKPLVILDESHKGKSPIAKDTLRNLNPSIVVELSATPHKESNILVDIRGIELKREEMIKLDLHIYNKADVDWKETLVESISHRNKLEKAANDYEANTGNHIRPICLIQVERTGKDQRTGRYIHSEDVKEHLIKLGIPEDYIAIKTSQKDELKEVDDTSDEGLLSKDIEIRYIITKQALQEGWDCPFAYVLTILTNPKSKNALTQLVGRILRQPFARKTNVLPLDESYVFTFQQNAADILKDIRQGFEGEGLGDLTTDIVTEEGFEDETTIKGKVYGVRSKYLKAIKHAVLPVFAIKGAGEWKMVDYETDIASRIDWKEVDITKLYSLKLSRREEGYELIASLAKDVEKLVEHWKGKKIRESGIDVDSVFLTRHLIDIVPNPWVAHEIGDKLLDKLLSKNDKKLVASNFVFIAEELRKCLTEEKDRLAKKVFLNLIEKDILRFLVIGDLGFRFNTRKEVSTASKHFYRHDGEPLQKSLFEFVADDEFDSKEERKVAWYLEKQEKLFFWHRNIQRSEYAIQGWRKHKIYPDFIFTTEENGLDKFNDVYILETKGLHLKNEDTAYKKSIFDLCTVQAKKANNKQLSLLKDKEYVFELLYEDEWESKLNEILN